MNTRKTLTIIVSLLVLSLLVVGLVSAADDGPLFGRNISRTPDTMTGASQMSIMPLYVPAQNPLGESVVISYTLSSTGEIINEMTEAKPIIATYNDGIEDTELNSLLGIDAINTGAGFGERDAFAALSLDDGATWKNWNLSGSADRSSFVLRDGHEYPGDVFKMVHQIEGNAVVAAWISRYCESGAPLYSWLEEEKDGLLTAYPELDHPVNVDSGTDPDGFYQLYMDDLFTVGGSQQSVDYTLQGFPEVGEIPYGCVWVARGTLEQKLDDDGAPIVTDTGEPVYEVTWRASERLTSGRRDPHQISISSSPGAGFYVMWQEDPEGLRPGKGLGPGEGWSGAIANSRTDTWYTYIDLAHVDDVCLDDVDDVYCTPGTLADYTTSELFGTKPKAAVPFAMPVRVTDNNMCKYTQKLDTNGDLLDPYCYADFNDNGTPDLCASSVDFLNAQNINIPVCATEDGRVLEGRTASTRARGTMKSYDSDGDLVPDSAWVLFGEERMKAIGTEDELLEPEDIGKNMWYHTFEFDKPELVQQGLMLNSPALSPATGEPFELLYDEWGYEFYDTEIARRFNLFVNSPAAAMASTSKTMGLLIYKEGIIRQGGPADIFIRRLVLPDGFDPQTMNPFAYENVQCASFDELTGLATPVDLLYPDDGDPTNLPTNPNYVRGLCPVQGMNVSGTTIDRCTDGSSGETCAAQFPYDLEFEDWYSEDEDTQIPKVLQWSQTEGNLNDPSWANPYDVSKGHRGFIDGDFVMMMYASAPNWKAGTVGNEAYNLYIRRSFDGGQTWTTLPASFAHINGLTYTGTGTTTCEDYGGYTEDEYEVCTTYPTGAFEQARNVSRLTGTKITVLDPRYSPTGGMLKLDYKSLQCPVGDGTWANCGYTEAPYPEEIRDPSAFFATYETGDNTVVTVEAGATPLDMYYSRASNFGDVWDEQDACSEGLEDPWYPTANCSDGLPDLRWDWLENGDDWATEASVEGNPDGSKFYAVWNQELFLGLDEDGVELYADMDSIFRRVFYNLYYEAVPTASIVFQSDFALDQSLDEKLYIVGTGRDLDRMNGDPNDIKWSWFDDKGAILCKVDDVDEDTGEIIYECEKEIEVKATDMEPGMNHIHMKVMDNEGVWSNDATISVFVAEHLYQVHLPSVVR